MVDVAFGVMPLQDRCPPSRPGCSPGPDNAVNLQADPILGPLPVPLKLRAEVGGADTFDLSAVDSQAEVYDTLGTLFTPATLRGWNGTAEPVHQQGAGKLAGAIRADPLQARNHMACMSCIPVAALALRILTLKQM